MYNCAYIYIYIYTYIYRERDIYIYIYIYIHKERELSTHSPNVVGTYHRAVREIHDKKKLAAPNHPPPHHPLLGYSI